MVDWKKEIKLSDLSRSGRRETGGRATDPETEVAAAVEQSAEAAETGSRSARSRS